MRTKDYFDCRKHTRTELILLLYISPFNSHLLSLRRCQDRSLMKQQCGGNALSICYYQLGNMTSTQDNMVHLHGRCSSCVPPYLHCNFTIQKPPVIGGGWNIWMLQALSTGCLYHHLQNRCTRNESFSNSRTAAGSGTCWWSLSVVLSKDCLDFLWEWLEICSLAVKEAMRRIKWWLHFECVCAGIKDVF